MVQKIKIITALIVGFSLIWVFQYFLGYVHQGLGFVLILVGFVLWFLLAAIGIVQLIQFVWNKEKQPSKLVFSVLILCLLVLSFKNPRGLIDWEKFDSENYLVAHFEGTASCLTVLKFKAGNKFKYASFCFGRSYHFGTYQMKGDTFFLQTKSPLPYMDTTSFAVLRKTTGDSTRYLSLSLYQNFEAKRSIECRIKSLDLDKLRQLNGG